MHNNLPLDFDIHVDLGDKQDSKYFTHKLQIKAV